MKELIKITEQDGQQTVSARELHEFVVKQAKGGQTGEMYAHWIKRMLGYGFEEGVDYVVVKYDYKGDIIFSKSDNQHVSKIDYALTSDCAKEISMIQRNDKGKQARKYFIKVEKANKLRFALPMNYAEALKELAKKVEEFKATLEDEEDFKQG